MYVFINDEKHFMQYHCQSLRIKVADDKPFEIRVKQTWDGSPTYTFYPIEDMVLLVSEKLRWQNIFAAICASVMIIAILVLFLTDYTHIWQLCFLIYLISYNAIYYTMRRKKTFEINTVEP